VRGVAEWLASIALEEYAELFIDNDIDLAVVRDLTEQDLKELGVSLGHRRRILRSASKLDASTAAKRQTAHQPLSPDNPERRQLTVMFCDLVGSAAIAAHLDVEDFRRLILSYNTRVTDVVHAYNGKIASYMGDGVLAYFGYPQAEEDDVEQAIRGGLVLIDTIANLRTDVKTELKARIGIATGVVVVGDLIGDGGAWERPIHGEPTNLAARLQSLAEPGTVLIDENTHRLAGGHFVYRDLGCSAIKGWKEQIPVWQVFGRSGVESRFEALHIDAPSSLFGREEEMKLLLRQWRRTLHQEGGAVLLTGEPGIGKSHIAFALADRLRSGRHFTLRYFCSAHHKNSALFPIINHLERAAGFERKDSPAEKRSKLESLIAESTATSDHAASLASLLDLPDASHDRWRHLSPQKRKEKISSALLSQLESLAAQRPVFMIFEDIQWIDPTSLELLTAIVERVPRLRVLVMLTARSEFTPPWPRLLNIKTIQLTPLTRNAGLAMLEWMTGSERLPKEVVEEILTRAEGVPLFIEELTKAVLEGGILGKNDKRGEFNHEYLRTIPRTLHGSLLTRLDRLGSSKEIAQIGAVIGREFSFELLQAITAMPEVVLYAALDRLVSSELVHRRCTPTLTTYVFKHVLVRDAAEGTLLRARRQELHETIARAMEEGFPEIVEAQPELIAHHYREASNVARAIHYFSVAGERALSRSALREAHEHVTQALELISRMAENDGRARDELRLQIALARTLLEQKGYADQHVGTAYAKARHLSRRLGDAALDLAAVYGLWAHHYIHGEPTAMLDLAREFLSLASAQNESGAIVVGHRLVGTSRLITGHIREATEAMDEAFVRYAPDVHGASSPDGQSLRARFGQDVGVTVYGYRSWALFLSGRPADAQKAAEEVLVRSDSFEQDDQSRFYSLWHAGMAYILLRNADRVAEIGNKLTQLANERELPYWQALGKFLRGWYARWADRPADAIALIQDGLRLWTQTNSRIFRPICLAFLADAYAAADLPELAEQTFEEALSIATQTGERWAEPEIHRLFGDKLARFGPLDSAIERYERAIAVARELGSRSFELRATTSLARVLSDQGEHTAGHDLLSSIYRTFDAKCGAIDLADAKTLLEATSAARKL
jgi:class 3 adenylate cyclase/tetratricopeptide (TPR) repeat protein